MENILPTWISLPIFEKVLKVLIWVLVIGIIERFFRKNVSKWVKDTDSRYRFRKSARLFFMVLLFIIVGSIFSDKLGNLGVALGVAGAGIAFALQEVIASFAGWLAILFGGFYSVGNRIQLGGIKGDVIDIGILRTTLMECGQWVDGDLYNGRIVRVANSFIFKEPVFNYSADFPFLWDEIKIPVKTDSNQKLAKEIIQGVSQKVLGDYIGPSREKWKFMEDKYRVEDISVEPMVTMVFDAAWVTYTLRYPVDYTKRRTTKDLLFTQILDKFYETRGLVSVAGASMEITQAIPKREMSYSKEI